MRRPPLRRPPLRRLLLLLPLFTVLLAVLLPGTGVEGQESDFKVIVNNDVEATSLPAKQLSRIFLKKIKRWEDDSSITVYDLDSDVPARDAFSRGVHGKSVSAIKSFWQRMIFSGRDVAPDEASTEDIMIQRVAATPGAIGYVSSGKALPDTVKVLEVEEK